MNPPLSERGVSHGIHDGVLTLETCLGGFGDARIIVSGAAGDKCTNDSLVRSTIQLTLKLSELIVAIEREKG